MPTNLPEVTLIRTDYHPEATLGRILKDGKEICKTLERPDRNNQKDDTKTKDNESSCIPEGIYLCKKYSSSQFPDTWEITEVVGRDHILFHSANTVNQLLGCVATAVSIQNMNPRNEGRVKPENKWYASQSKDAFAKFKAAMPKQFKLKITSNKTLCNLK